MQNIASLCWLWSILMHQWQQCPKKFRFIQGFSGKQFLYTTSWRNCRLWKSTTRPSWERCTIALACPCTCHIKNTNVACCTPKTLYDVLSQLFLVHSFSTLLITVFIICLIKSLVYLSLTFDLRFFFHIVTFGFWCSCYLLNTLKQS